VFFVCVRDPMPASSKLIYFASRFVSYPFRHGNGRWVNPNGDCYEGSFVYDARHGSGIYTWKNGNVYRGDFFEDKRQGKVSNSQSCMIEE
jgi:hypothetical protein